MTMEEIGRLNLKQAVLLLQEHALVNQEKFESLKKLAEKNSKGAMGVIDLSRPIYG